MSSLPSTAYAGDRASAPRHSRLPQALSARLVALRAAFSHDPLDRALARGVDPTGGPLLAARAAQLARRRHRVTLARTLRRTVDEALQPRPPARAAAVPFARAQVRADADHVLALADRLDAPQPACVTGIAMAQRLVTDAVASPLYADCDPDVLGRLARQAIASMDEPRLTVTE